MRPTHGYFCTPCAHTHMVKGKHARMVAHMLTSHFSPERGDRQVHLLVKPEELITLPSVSRYTQPAGQMHAHTHGYTHLHAHTAGDSEIPLRVGSTRFFANYNYISLPSPFHFPPTLDMNIPALVLCIGHAAQYVPIIKTWCVRWKYWVWSMLQRGESRCSFCCSNINCWI